MPTPDLRTRNLQHARTCFRNFLRDVADDNDYTAAFEKVKNGEKVLDSIEGLIAKKDSVELAALRKLLTPLQDEYKGKPECRWIRRALEAVG